MEIGDITALTEYAIMILFYLVMAQMVMVMLPRALVCIERIQEVLELEPEIQDGTACGKKTDGGGNVKDISSNEEAPVICFKNVSFRFKDAG